MSKPLWLKKKVAYNTVFQNVQAILKNHALHTVCEEAQCPNRGDCYSSGTATFLILGDRCTRSCSFCAVSHDLPLPPDTSEPVHVAEAVHSLGLQYAVITSVTRDDLPDGGASHFADTIRRIRSLSPETLVEVLIPDFKGSEEALGVVVGSRPEVLGHNMETVSRLYPVVRPGADYSRSLALMKRVHEMDPSIIIKSGLMLGMGETADEIRCVLTDLLSAGCSILTLGQYLQPHEKLLPVYRYVTPEEFDQWRDHALYMGFREVASGPFVRSSYHAEEHFRSIKQKENRV